MLENPSGEAFHTSVSSPEGRTFSVSVDGGCAIFPAASDVIEFYRRGYNNGVIHGYVLVPIPEPGTLALLGTVVLGLGGYLFVRRRRRAKRRTASETGAARGGGVFRRQTTTHRNQEEASDEYFENL